MKSKEAQYIELKESLERAAKLNDEKLLETLIINNRELINSIVNEYGPGNVFLLSPYDILYSNHNYKTSGLYQDLLEQINPMALLGEDE